MARPVFVGLALAAVLGVGCQEAVVVAPPTVLPPPATLPTAMPTGDAGAAVVAFAQAQVGLPYCWGGTGPRCFDCSGLAQVAWRRVGVRLPRSADAIPGALPEIPLKTVQPGDILWWPGHVALYAGDGWSIEALNAKSGVVRRRCPPPRRAFRPHVTG